MLTSKHLPNSLQLQKWSEPLPAPLYLSYSASTGHMQMIVSAHVTNGNNNADVAECLE